MRGFRPLIVAASLLAFAVTALAAEGTSGAQRFGAQVRVKKPVNIAQLAQNPAKFKGKTIRLEGTVKDVCQGRGCWVEVEDGKGASFMARSLDESILLPKDCKGQHVVVEGLVMTLPAAVKEEAEPADHACPKPNYVVSTKGVELAAAAHK